MLLWIEYCHLMSTVQVGYSEALRELRCDARWWLVNSLGRTRIAIIIHVTYKPNEKSVLLETWQMVDNPGGIARATPPTVPAVMPSDSRQSRGGSSAKCRIADPIWGCV